MPKTKPSYISSDAWILTSLAYAINSGKGTLSRIIGAGDYINHAILTRSELNGGISRLIRGDLITESDEGYALTPDGIAVTHLEKDSKVSAYEHMKTVGESIGAAAWKPGEDPNDCDDNERMKTYVSENDLEKAFQEYKKGLK